MTNKCSHNRLFVCSYFKRFNDHFNDSIKKVNKKLYSCKKTFFNFWVEKNIKYFPKHILKKMKKLFPLLLNMNPNQVVFPKTIK